MGRPGAGYCGQHRVHLVGGAHTCECYRSRAHADSFFCLCPQQGLPTTLALAAGTQTDSKRGSIFITGLLAGCTTFGGAFTAVPCAPGIVTRRLLARTVD